MSFMVPVIYPAAETFATNCDCGATCYWHPLASSFARDSEDTRCDYCGESLADAEWESIGMMYAGRYSAPGYLDCTDWSFAASADALRAELNEMYGDNEDTDDCDDCDDDPRCDYCGERHPVVVHDDDCVYAAGVDGGECICGDAVIGAHGYVSVSVECIDAES